METKVWVIFLAQWPLPMHIAPHMLREPCIHPASLFWVVWIMSVSSMMEKPLKYIGQWVIWVVKKHLSFHFLAYLV